jgi:hypothetical protein
MPSSNKDNSTDVESVTSNLAKQVSTLNKKDDPFAPRDGKTLLWRNIHMTLVSASLDMDTLDTLDT